MPSQNSEREIGWLKLHKNGKFESVYKTAVLYELFGNHSMYILRGLIFFGIYLCISNLQTHHVFVIAFYPSLVFF